MIRERIKNLKDSLEERAKEDLKQGGKHLLSSPVSVLGNAIHAIGSLVYGAGRLIRGAGHVGGKTIDIAGTGAGRIAGYLSDRVAGVPSVPRQKYVTIPIKKYKELLELEPEKEYNELVKIAHKHGHSVRIPVERIQEVIEDLRQYSGHQRRYHPHHRYAAIFLLFASLILADFTVTGAAIGVGGFAFYAPVFSLLFLLGAIALFFRR